MEENKDCFLTIRDNLIKSRGSYAARFAEWIVRHGWELLIETTDEWHNIIGERTIFKTTSQLLELFNEQDKMEKK